MNEHHYYLYIYIYVKATPNKYKTHCNKQSDTTPEDDYQNGQKRLS